MFSASLLTCNYDHVEMSSLTGIKGWLHYFKSNQFHIEICPSVTLIGCIKAKGLTTNCNDNKVLS